MIPLFTVLCYAVCHLCHLTGSWNLGSCSARWCKYSLTYRYWLCKSLLPCG